jgi:hypothetical protein
MKKAVIDGVLQHVSASQIATFSRCNRLWYFQKVVGLREPDTAAQAEGTRIHGQLEEYYKSGKLPEHEAALKAVNELLPKWDSGNVHSEFPRDYVTGLVVAGVPVNGRIDLFDSALDTVWDFKTAKSFRYALTPKDLAVSPQMLMYGKFIFELCDADEVTLRHLYIHKTKADLKVSECSFTPEKLQPKFEKHVVAPAKLMVECAGLKDIAEVEGDYSACNDYGGCPFFDKCHNVANMNRQPTKDLANMFDHLPSDPEVKVVDDVEQDIVEGPELILFVDCVPLKGVDSFKLLEDEIAKRAVAVCAKFNVNDVREAPFGQGTSALVATFRAEPLMGVWVATTNGLSMTVVDALVASADMVVRGTR